MNNLIIFLVAAIGILTVIAGVLVHALYKTAIKYNVYGKDVAGWIVRIFSFPKKQVEKYRTKKAIKLWNFNVDIINASVSREPDVNSKYLAQFKWTQLVWQEITMYIMIASQVEVDELSTLCKSRGFSQEQKDFLIYILVAIGLGDNLDVNEKMEFRLK